MSALPMLDEEPPLLVVEGLTVAYGNRVGCRDVGFELWPGEVLGIVGESGSGKTSLLNELSAKIEPAAGTIHYRLRDGTMADLFGLSEAVRRQLLRTDWGVVHQNPRDGLRLTVSAPGTGVPKASCS